MEVAIINDNLEELGQLLMEGGNIDEALIMATQHGRFDIAKILLEEGADPRADGNDALGWAILTMRPDLVQLLLHYGADANAENGLAMKYAIRDNRPDIVDLLMTYGAKWKDNNEPMSNEMEDLLLSHVFKKQKLR